MQNTPSRANPDVMVVESTMYVNNPDQVMNDAFKRLGSTTTGTAGYGGSGTPDYTRIEGTPPNVPAGQTHTQLGDGNGNAVFDPWSSALPLTDVKLTPIYLH